MNIDPMIAEIHISAILGAVFILLYAITIIGLVLLVLLENRNPLKTIPWVIVLIFVPGIGLIFYYFFGRDNRRLRIISRRTYRRIMKEVAHTQGSQIYSNEIPPNYHPLVNLLNNSNYSAIFYGCKVTAYTNGADKFKDLAYELNRAKSYIHLQYYIFNDDEIGNEIKDILVSKAKEGVKVRVLYDNVGCWHTKRKFFQEMKENGIEVYSFLKVAFPILTSKVNYRNHRKVVVIDGKVGFMGGMNIADRYCKGNKLGPWRDTHFKIVGNGVHGLQASFLTDWYAMSRQLLKGEQYYPEAENYTDMSMQIVTSGPTGQWRTLLQAFIFCIANAKKYIYIQTPYFLPTEGLNQALQMAALSGIDVRLMIPEHSDTRSAQMATFSYVDKMLDAGVKVYLYKSGFLHSKLMLIDDEVACIGSSNFDFRSFEHNFEINAFVYQKGFAKDMKKMFMKDLRRDCKAISPYGWRRRPLAKRLLESFMRLFSPLL